MPVDSTKAARLLRPQNHHDTQKCVLQQTRSDVCGFFLPYAILKSIDVSFFDVKTTADLMKGDGCQICASCISFKRLLQYWHKDMQEVRKPV